MKKLLPLLLAFTFIQPSHAAPAPAPTTATPQKIDPAAVALLDHSAAAYAALKSLSMKFKVVAYGNRNIWKNEGTLAFSRPEGAKLEFQYGANIMSELLKTRLAQTFAADQQKIYGNKDDKTYQSLYLLDSDPIVSITRRLPSNLAIPFEFIVAGQNPLRVNNLLKWESAQIAANNSVIINAQVGQSGLYIAYRLFFGQDDFLIRRAECLVDQLGREDTEITDLQINPVIAPGTLRYIPAQGAQEEALTPRYSPLLKVGGTPFSLHGTDLRSYLGQVVLINFWAMDGASSSETRSKMRDAYEKYRGRGFEIIEIPFDIERTWLRSYLETENMPWLQLFDERGDNDPNIVRYGVTELPFSLLLDKNGKIAVINPRGNELESEIKKLLNSNPAK